MTSVPHRVMNIQDIQSSFFPLKFFLFLLGKILQQKKFANVKKRNTCLREKSEKRLS